MSTLKTDTLSNVAGSFSIGVDRVAQGTAAAWVNFNGTGVVAIRASYNVSSITDHAPGNYTVNFSTNLPDANYAMCGSGSNGTSEATFIVTRDASAVPTVSGIRIGSIGDSPPTSLDTAYISVSIFR